MWKIGFSVLREFKKHSLLSWLQAAGAQPLLYLIWIKFALLFWKKVLQKKERKNSGDRILKIDLKLIFASSGTVLKKLFTKNGEKK